LKNAGLAKLLAGLLQRVRQVPILKSKICIRYSSMLLRAWSLLCWVIYTVQLVKLV